MEELLKIVKRKITIRKVNLVIGLILGLTGLIFCFIWYDWRLFIILFLLLWSNNISISRD